MSTHYALTATKRDQAGKGAARSLRREDRIPAVIYGDKKEPVLISLPSKEVNLEYYKGHMFTNLCDMVMDGQKQLLLARDVQLHPVTDVVEHVDFMRVTPKTKIAVHVPVKFINEDKSPSLANKGTLNVVRHEVELLCTAIDIPEYVEVNVEGKEHGDAVKISNAVLPKGTSPVITNRDFTIATLVPPRTAAQEAADAPVAAAPADAAAPAAGAAAAPAAGAKPAAKK